MVVISKSHKQSKPSIDTLEKLNEGLGGAYERYAYSRVIAKHMQERGLKTVLEFDATYIAGIPGFNSCLLARDGFDVTVTVNERDYDDAVHAWSLLGLSGPNVHLIRDDGSLSLPEKSFDLVYNHLAFEHYKDPQVLIQEMKRLSKDVVLNLTLAPYNLGFVIHWLAHKFQGKRWDHGIVRQTMVGAMKKAHKEAGLTFLERGAADVPPWMDTVDGQMKGSMTYLDGYPEDVRKKWIWCSGDPDLATRRWIRWMWFAEETMPDWFKMLVGHHLYVSSTVKGS